MIGACIAVGQHKDYAPVWTGQEPASFGQDLEALQGGYDAAIAKAKLAELANDGSADTKAVAEALLEEAAYVLARALAVHLKKKQDLTRRAQVDLTRSQIVRLRENDLVTKAESIRDLGVAVLAEFPDAPKNGVNTVRVEALSGAIVAFKTAMALPRGKIVNRGTLLKEVETDTAALLEDVADLDDLVLQFDNTAQGKRFIEAWKKARIIVDRVATMTPKPSTTTKTATTESGTAAQ